MYIRWNIPGFVEIRRSPEIQDLVSDLSDTILAELPQGYVASGRQGRSRYREIIFADTSLAFRDQIRHNSLQKVLYGLGGS